MLKHVQNARQEHFATAMYAIVQFVVCYYVSLCLTRERIIAGQCRTCKLVNL